MNSHVAHTSILLAHYPTDSFFDIVIFGVKASEGILVAKMYVFHHCVVNLNSNARFLMLCWKEHVRLYPKVVF
jgi:hypothetical protein